MKAGEARESLVEQESKVSTGQRGERGLELLLLTFLAAQNFCPHVVLA